MNGQEYMVLEEDSPEGLASLVNAAIGKGWDMQGGVALALVSVPETESKAAGVTSLYAQAMKREVR